MALSERPTQRRRVPPLDLETPPPAGDPGLGDGSGPAAPGPAGGPGDDWRASVLTASGINVLCGVWLIIAPWVLGYADGDPRWNDVWAGAVVAVLALARVSGAYRASWMSYINALIGCWLFAAAFWLDSSHAASANDIVLGIVIFALAVLSATASDEAAARERRWYGR